jgi:asparagine synthase (glutamine-hydrolysing)
MCGILGIVNFNGDYVNEGLLIRMRDTMKHRGPDDSGVFVDGAVGLAHRRLSVIDLSSAGRQPMTNEDRRLWLVCNGEIYNYLELFADLKKKGHVFRSNSDSEVILHLYEEEGESCVQKLNGMFAFAIWDRKNRVLFAARDRLGIKPLYLYSTSKRLIFSSEVKAILEDESVPRTPNTLALSDYFFCEMALAEKTMFAGINQLEPGRTLTVKDGNVTINKYWDIVYNYNTPRPEQSLMEELSTLLEDAVRIHCRSDASLGCHLSGGMDTSTIVSLASRYRNDLKTFSIKFDGDKYYDETIYAKAVEDHVGAKYIESTPRARDLSKLLPSLIWHMDGPMLSDGGFAYHAASSLASEHVKVSLTGHGGDEVFAGYPAQFHAIFGNTNMFDLYREPPRSMSILRQVLTAFSSYGVYGVLHRMAKRLKPPKASLENIWMALHCNYPTRENPILHPGFVKSLNGYSSEEEYLKPLRSAPTDMPLDQCLYHDIRLYLPGLLHMEDRASMSVSLESRVPILDYRIVELLATVPPEQKIKGGEPKYLLRSVASSWIPDQVLNRRDKAPFPVPTDNWFSGELAPMIWGILLSPACLDRGILNPDALRRKTLNANSLWSAVNLELWFKIFIDRHPSWVRRSGLQSQYNSGCHPPSDLSSNVT